jgi:hypothetical protein
MNSPCRCQNDRCAREEARQQESWFIRARKVAGLIVPSTLLTLLPKCPMCLAAYVALGTGFTMSYASAHVLMRTLTGLCIGTLALCVARLLINYSSRKQTIPFQPTPVRS